MIKTKVYDAFYKLDYPHDQITSYVFDVVRAEVPKMKLDDVFVKKDDIAIAVKSELNQAMMDYGYDIIKTLVTDIDPDPQVKEAMNRINASEREKIAAQFEGDAARILIVEKAKAEAESKRLQGQGIADQRREIARGLEESVEVLNKVGINSQEASALIVVTQHYDTLQSIGQETTPIEEHLHPGGVHTGSLFGVSNSLVVPTAFVFMCIYICIYIYVYIYILTHIHMCA